MLREMVFWNYTSTHLPKYSHRYDHLNYAKWGAVYVAKMNQLPGEVEKEFQDGNFVVKFSN